MRTIFQYPPESLTALEEAKKKYKEAFISGKESFQSGYNVIVYTVYSVPYRGKHEEQPKVLHQISYSQN